MGLDTNQLNGDGFKIFVDPDQVVKQGDILLTFDSEILKNIVVLMQHRLFLQI